jgi:hypothetical protein
LRFGYSVSDKGSRSALAAHVRVCTQHAPWSFAPETCRSFTTVAIVWACECASRLIATCGMATSLHLYDLSEFFGVTPTLIVQCKMSPYMMEKRCPGPLALSPRAHQERTGYS